MIFHTSKMSFYMSYVSYIYIYSYKYIYIHTNIYINININTYSLCIHLNPPLMWVGLIFAEQAAGTDSESKCGKVGEGRKGRPASRIS